MYTYKFWKTQTDYGTLYNLKIYDPNGELVFGDSSYGFSYLSVMASDFDIKLDVKEIE